MTTKFSILRLQKNNDSIKLNYQIQCHTKEQDRYDFDLGLCFILDFLHSSSYGSSSEIIGRRVY